MALLCLGNTMTNRERMLAAFRGEALDWIPFAPRMDLWSLAHQTRGTVPRAFEGLNMVELAKAMDTAAHAVRGDFTLRGGPSNGLNGLGCGNAPDFPYHTELRGIPYEVDSEKGNTVATFHTAAGDITTQLEYTRQMRGDGISLSMVKSYPIESLDDFEGVAQIFEHLQVVPKPDGYGAFKQMVGEQGVAVAAGAVAASPVHAMLHDLMPMDRFFYLYLEEREAMQALAERMTPYFEACLEACVQSDAEAVTWGNNYDRDLTWPPFFEEEIAPWLKKASDRLHAAGKLLVTHCDGENRGLFPLYRHCGIDVAESVCTAPMVECTLAELREGFGPNTAVFGGIPSVALLDDAMDAASFDGHLDELFGHLGTGEGLVLGVSDNVPPDANLDRFRPIKERIEAFGAVRPAASG